jgi:hypothetical protein
MVIKQVLSLICNSHFIQDVGFEALTVVTRKSTLCGYDTMMYGGSSQLWRNILPPSPGLASACCLFLANLWLGITSLEMEEMCSPEMLTFYRLYIIIIVIPARK